MSELTPVTPGFYYVILAVLTFVYLICSIRTNVCLFLALFLLVITFGLLAGVFFQLALGNAVQAAKLQTVCHESLSPFACSLWLSKE